MKRIKFYLAILVATIASESVVAQHFNADSTWNYGGHAGLTFNQVGQWNWAAGGENRIGANIRFDYSAEYKKAKHLSNNRVELEYGFNIADDKRMKKNNDKIYLSSNYGYELGNNIYVSGLFNFTTQFADGYNYSADPTKPDTFISTFLAPGYLVLGAGFTWSPSKVFNAVLNPAAYRGVFVFNDQLSNEGQFGVTPGQRYLSQLGAHLQMEVDYDNLVKNVDLYTRVSLFSNYLKKPQNVDVNWDVKLDFNVNKWLSASLSTSLIYDDDIMIVDKNGNKGPKLQFQEVIGLGIQLKL